MGEEKPETIENSLKVGEEKTSRRILLRIAYDGTAYHGWQEQEKQEVPTVEGEVNRALGEVTGEEIHVIGGSRTDAGVHAYDNVAVFDTFSRIPAERFPYALNRFLPEDIRVHSGREVEADFHPRHCDTQKTYEYRILCARHMHPELRFTTWWMSIPLDVAKMQQAAGALEGEHDFTSFCSVNAQSDTRVRRIYRIEVEEQVVRGYVDARLITIRVSGNGFLYNMVRIIAGTLAMVGMGKILPEDMPAILEKKERGAAGTTAPPQGLTLVEYRFL